MVWEGAIKMQPGAEHRLFSPKNKYVVYMLRTNLWSLLRPFRLTATDTPSYGLEGGIPGGGRKQIEPRFQTELGIGKKGGRTR